MYTRNSDPNFFQTHYTNCGSFALNIQEWYSPDEVFIDEYGDVEDWINDCYMMGMSEDEISDEFSWKLVDIILEDFNDLMYRSNFDPADLEPGEELIAFRATCEETGMWDFHFKVFRNGHWQEKVGSNPVQDCSGYDWSNGAMEYVSTTHYFVKKVA